MEIRKRYKQLYLVSAVELTETTPTHSRIAPQCECIGRSKQIHANGFRLLRCVCVRPFGDSARIVLGDTNSDGSHKRTHAHIETSTFNNRTNTSTTFTMPETGVECDDDDYGVCGDEAAERRKKIDRIQVVRLSFRSNDKIPFLHSSAILHFSFGFECERCTHTNTRANERNKKTVIIMLLHKIAANRYARVSMLLAGLGLFR